MLVLIDTWWNVNCCSQTSWRFRMGFNRYMVECESRIASSDSGICNVLIDTWWNVNCDNQIRVLEGREF